MYVLLYIHYIIMYVHNIDVHFKYNYYIYIYLLVYANGFKTSKVFIGATPK